MCPILGGSSTRRVALNRRCSVALLFVLLSCLPALGQNPVPFVNLVQFNSLSGTAIDNTGNSLSNLTISAAGVISGVFHNPSGTNAATSIPINGLYIPAASQGAGFFLDQGVSGEFLLMGLGE